MRHEVYCPACKQWIDIRDVEVKSIEGSQYNREEYITFTCLKCESEASQRSLVRIGY